MESMDCDTARLDRLLRLCQQYVAGVNYLKLPKQRPVPTGADDAPPDPRAGFPLGLRGAWDEALEFAASEATAADRSLRPGCSPEDWLMFAPWECTRGAIRAAFTPVETALVAGGWDDGVPFSSFRRDPPDEALYRANGDHEQARHEAAGIVEELEAELHRLRLAADSVSRSKARAEGKPRRRRKVDPKPRPLTDKQTEAVHMVGECKGNVTEAANRLGRDRKTVEQHYKAAMKKLGKSQSEHLTIQSRADRRGQATIATGDDRRL
jgi:DNA-binding CsgD family transcriptional regulator